MATSPLVPKNGAVAYGSLVWDYNNFSIEVSQSVETITPYGTGITCSVNVGSGTPDFTFNTTAFALAHSTNTVPNLPGTSTIFTSGGATATFTADTGCTENCTAIVERFTLSHSRMRGAVPAQIRLRNAGEVTEAWATV